MVVGYHLQVIFLADYPLFKIGNKTEKKSRPFGYNVKFSYLIVSINDLSEAQIFL